METNNAEKEKNERKAKEFLELSKILSKKAKTRKGGLFPQFREIVVPVIFGFLLAVLCFLIFIPLTHASGLELSAPPISWFYYSNSNCHKITDIYSGDKQYCPGTVISSLAIGETKDGKDIFTLPYNSRVEVNWVDSSDERYSIAYCEMGINSCKNPLYGFVDKKVILLDVDVMP